MQWNIQEESDAVFNIFIWDQNVWWAVVEVNLLVQEWKERKKILPVLSAFSFASFDMMSWWLKCGKDILALKCRDFKGKICLLDFIKWLKNGPLKLPNMNHKKLIGKKLLKVAIPIFPFQHSWTWPFHFKNSKQTIVSQNCCNWCKELK